MFPLNPTGFNFPLTNTLTRATLPGMPIDIHGLAKHYESIPGLDIPLIMESVKEFRASLQGRKKELLAPFGLDNLDKFKDNPDAFMKMVSFAVDSFREKKEQNSTYKKIYKNGHCLVTFTNKPEGAAAAGSHLKVEGEVRCPWCICVKHPENEKWWKHYEASALVFLYSKDDACCILLTAPDALSILDGTFKCSQVEGIENRGLNNKPEEQREVLERLYGETGLSDDRLVEILRPVLKPMRGALERKCVLFDLFAAVKNGDAELVKDCLAKGADVNDPLNGKKSPLHWAAEKGFIEICKLLIEAGADLSTPDNCDKTPLHWAAEKGFIEICKLLIDAGADLEATAWDRRTPLHWAAYCDSPETCKTLIDAGADVNARNKYGSTPLHYAMWKLKVKIGQCLAGDDRPETCKVLVEADADVNAGDERGRTPLHLAALYDRVECCKVLIGGGAELNYVDKEGWTPLCWAARYGSLDVCKALVAAGANVNFVDRNGNTPLSLARIGNYPMVEKVLANSGTME